MSDELLKRLETGHDKECAMSYGMHEHCCDCSYTVRQEAAARVRELEAERDSVQHLFEQQERHRDELLAENAALRALLRGMRAAHNFGSMPDDLLASVDAALGEKP